jgi:hypothetical protein
MWRHTLSSNSSSGHTAVPLELQNSSEVHLLLIPLDYDLCCPHKHSLRTCRKHVMWSLSNVVWRHCRRGSMFTEPLPRNGLHNSAVLLLLACNAGCLLSRWLAMPWHVTILKWILRVYRERWELDLNETRQNIKSVSSSVIRAEFFDQLKAHELHKKVLVIWLVDRLNN